MFAQVIQGRTSDAKAFASALDRWMQDLAPGAVGWLGSTGGVTDDGRVIAVVRFESADAAARNSDRPEQIAVVGGDERRVRRRRHLRRQRGRHRRSAG